MSSKLTYEHSGGKVVVEVNEDLESMEDIVDQLIVPVLLGATFAPVTILRYIQTNTL